MTTIRSPASAISAIAGWFNTGPNAPDTVRFCGTRYSFGTRIDLLA